jgi:hypothetical protein
VESNWISWIKILFLTDFSFSNQRSTKALAEQNKNAPFNQNTANLDDYLNSKSGYTFKIKTTTTINYKLDNLLVKSFKENESYNRTLNLLRLIQLYFIQNDQVIFFARNSFLFLNDFYLSIQANILSWSDFIKCDTKELKTFYSLFNRYNWLSEFYSWFA